jgi:hypothetical protein
MAVYLIHGLTLSLPFACDELDPAPPGAIADAWVVEGVVPRALAEPVLREPGFDASPAAFLLRGGSRSARFLVEGGTTITFERNPKCEQPLFLHHLLYQAMAALLRQRGLLVFHASAALSPTGAVVVTGDSGAGKSTTIARLTALGWPLQTDDVSALRVAAGRGLEVLAGASRVHLYEGSATALELKTAGLAQHDWHRMKMAVPAGVRAERGPEPVRRIVLLRNVPGAALRIERVTGRAKIGVLLAAAYGPLFPEQIGAQAAIFARALEQVEMLEITRPDGAWTLDAVIAAISDA